MAEKRNTEQTAVEAQQAENSIPQRDSIGKAICRNLKLARVRLLWQRGWRCLRTRGLQALWREVAFRVNLMLHRDTWRHRADIPLARELRAQRARWAVAFDNAKIENNFDGLPKISILVPVWNTPIGYFDDMVKSVRRQSYPNWELVLADASGAPAPGETASPKCGVSGLQKRAKKYRDSRIKYLRLERNENISCNTNHALEASTGDYLALLDHDDLLMPNALHETVLRILDGAQFVYSDEIVLNGNLKKLVQYHFKPDWCPEQLQSCNYITHFSVFSRQLLQKAGGGERSQYDGAQDYDLILRLTEQCADQPGKIAHIPQVLYIWRSHATSTASDISAKPYALEAGRKALEAHFVRIGLTASVETQPQYPGTYHPTIAVEGNPCVSVLIPNKDHSDDLERCLKSLYANAGWGNMEVLVIENNSTDPETFLYYEKAAEKYPRLRVVTWPGSFNFSAINNFGAGAATGEHLLLLNNDMEITRPGFVREMLSYSQQTGIGAVGGKLIYPDHTIQHAGVIIGIGGTAGHSHKALDADNGGDLNRLVSTQNYLAVTGACLMVKAALYQELNGLDELDFAVAYNDVDFCLRLVEKGLRNVYTPYAQATHYESKSRGYDTAGANLQRYNREKTAFIAKYGWLINSGDPCYNPHFTYVCENYGYK